MRELPNGTQISVILNDGVWRASCYVLADKSFGVRGHPPLTFNRIAIDLGEIVAAFTADYNDALSGLDDNVEPTKKPGRKRRR